MAFCGKEDGFIAFTLIMLKWKVERVEETSAIDGALDGGAFYMVEVL